MQKMDCHNFKEMLDSYFCEELTVETNHSILSHAEHCPPCRSEMASRRNMRLALQRACAQDKMSDSACERLRARLRAEAGVECTSGKQREGKWVDRWAAIVHLKFPLPVMAGAAALIVAVISAAVYLPNPLKSPVRLDSSDTLPKKGVAVSRISDELFAAAAGGHRKCSLHVQGGEIVRAKADEFRNFDDACIDLDKVVEQSTSGLRPRLAHVCGGPDRQFAHLIYPHEGQFVSILVTQLDADARQTKRFPLQGTTPNEVQELQQTNLTVDAYQTERHIVFVVSELPKSENQDFARTLALSVVNHFRQIENRTAFSKWPEFELLANVRGGELR